MTDRFQQHGGTLPRTGRLEWDDERGCIALRYVSPWKARVRCECLTGLEMPGVGAFLALTFPVTLPIMAGTLLFSSREECTLSLFAWGIGDSTPRLSLQAAWPEVRRVNLRGHNLFVLWKPQSQPANPGCYFPRECFADEDEALFCYQTLLALWQSRGESWSMARSRLLARQALRQAREQNGFS